MSRLHFESEEHGDIVLFWNTFNTHIRRHIDGDVTSETISIFEDPESVVDFIEDVILDTHIVFEQDSKVKFLKNYDFVGGRSHRWKLVNKSCMVICRKMLDADQLKIVTAFPC